MAKPLYDVQVHFQVSESMKSGLTALAEKKGVRLSELLRDIIRGYLDDEDRLLAERNYLAERGRQAGGLMGERT